MPKIQLIINGWVLRHPLGGIALYVRLLVEGLSASGADLEWRVAIPGPHRHLTAFVPEDRLLIVEGSAKVDGYVMAEIYWNQKISSFVRRHHPDAVFHSAFHFWAALRPRYTMITAHDCIEQRLRAKMTWPRRLYRRLCWSAVRGASRVLTVSNWTRQDLVDIECVPAGKIVTLYNWVRPSFLKPIPPEQIQAMRERYGLPEQYIAYVGGYRGYKNVGMLIEAWGRARAQAQIPALALAGHIPDLNHDECRVHAALASIAPLGEQVIRPGIVRDEDLAAFYAGSVLFVSPSRFEGFGYPAVEAMATGKPLLVADATAFRELVTNANARFDPDDVKTLAEKILAALERPGDFTERLPQQFTATEGIRRYIAIVRSVRSSESSVD